MAQFAVLFPGQGSQFVGMGGELFEARPDLLGARADEVLGWSLRELCLESSEERLTRTEYAQPALFAVAYALWCELAVAQAPAAAAGHSLGEYTALVAAGAIDYLDALRVVAERGRAMASASDLEPSGMAAVLGAELETVEAVVAERRRDGGRLWVANINAPGQIVVAGGAEDLEWLAENRRGIRRVVPLKVAGAFHSPLMAPAVTALEEALAPVGVSDPDFDVYANVDAGPFTVERVKTLLVRQITSPVRFADTIAAMHSAGVSTFVHVGPGDVTAGMARRAAPDAEVLVVSEIADIEAISKSFPSINGGE